jgi:hypothetical protein
MVSRLFHPVTQVPDNKQNKLANLSEKIHMTPIGQGCGGFPLMSGHPLGLGRPALF